MQHLIHEGHEEKGHAGLRRLEPGLADPCGHERMAPELGLAQYREDRGAAAPTGLLAVAPESEDLAAESGERRRRSQTNQRNQDREERYHHGAPAPAGLLAAAPKSEVLVVVDVPESGRALVALDWDAYHRTGAEEFEGWRPFFHAGTGGGSGRARQTSSS